MNEWLLEISSKPHFSIFSIVTDPRPAICSQELMALKMKLNCCQVGKWSFNTKSFVDINLKSQSGAGNHPVLLDSVCNDLKDFKDLNWKLSTLLSPVCTGVNSTQKMKSSELTWWGSIPSECFLETWCQSFSRRQQTRPRCHVGQQHFVS